MRAMMVILGLVLAAGGVAAQEKPQATVAHGEQIYKNVCWTCHGLYGRGDGPAAQYLAVRPPDLTDPGVLAGRSDAEMVELLTARKARPSSTHMPMATITETIKEDALRDAIAYMRTLAVPGKHVSVQAGKDIYNTFCQGCHGSRGDGKGPAAKNLVGVTPRDFTSTDFVIEGREEEIYQTIFMGAEKASHGSPYMPQWRTTLSRQQVEDIIEYLKTFKKPQP